MLGMQSMVWDEAVKITGADPDFHRRDLFDVDHDGEHPGVGARASSCSPRRTRERSTSITSTRPSSSPRSWCRCTSSGGWCSTASRTTSSPRPSRSPSAPQNLVPGIDFSDDPLLQGRNFSYLDTQLSAARLDQLPPAADQRAEVPVRQHAARRPHADAHPQGRASPMTPSLIDPSGPREDPEPASAASPPPSSGAEGARPLGDASPTTTARRGCSSSARPSPSRSTSRRRWSSSCRRSSCRSSARRCSATSPSSTPTLGERVAAGLGHHRADRPRNAGRRAARPRRARAQHHRQGPPTLVGRLVGILVTDGARRRRSAR